MAKRPIFISIEAKPYSQEVMVDFEWFPGFAVSQKQKSIVAFHRAAIELGLCKKPLEISSKSEIELGRALSAFNLKVNTGSNRTVAVENIFQASKVFFKGGPFRDLLNLSPIEAKRDIRLKESGDLIAFQGKSEKWPIEPKTMFYDWIYLNALHRNENLAAEVMNFDAFTDIEFNPTKSFNCQANSVALYISLQKHNLLDELLNNSELFKCNMINLKSNNPNSCSAVQQSLI